MPKNRTVKHRERVEAMRANAEARVAPPVVEEKPAPKKKTAKKKTAAKKKK